MWELDKKTLVETRVNHKKKVYETFALFTRWSQVVFLIRHSSRTKDVIKTCLVFIIKQKKKKIVLINEAEKI